MPLDYEPYARRIEAFANEVERRWNRLPGAERPELLANVRDAAAVMRAAAARFNDRRETALRKPDGSGFEPLNRQLLLMERALLDADGLPGRPWYRHLIYAPRLHVCARGPAGSVGGHRGRRWRPSPRPGTSPCRRSSERRCSARSPQLTDTPGPQDPWSFVPRKHKADFVRFKKDGTKRQESVASRPKTSHTIRGLFRRIRPWMPA